MTEAIFHEVPTKVTIYTNERTPETKETGNNKSPALIINTQGKSYGDVLKKIKSNINDNPSAQIIRSIKKTKNDIIKTDKNREQIKA